MPKDYEDIDQEYNQSFNKVKYIIFTILTLPILLYLFIILPAKETTKINLPELIKIDKLHELQQDQRLILIGDVHGCLKPLKQLVDKLNFNNQTDQIILLGDYISKGPNSIEVLDYSIEQGFKGVLGNHELSILSKYSNLNSIKFNDDDLYTLDSIPKSFDKEFNIARRLTPEHIKYITSMPLFLELGSVHNEKEETLQGIATHLGIDPSKSLKHQKIMDLLSIDRKWFKIYNKFTEKQALKNRKVIYYGHHASLGLNLNKYSKGLDSGCVKGGELTAAVISVETHKHEPVYKKDIISVKC